MKRGATLRLCSLCGFGIGKCRPLQCRTEPAEGGLHVQDVDVVLPGIAVAGKTDQSCARIFEHHENAVDASQVLMQADVEVSDRCFDSPLVTEEAPIGAVEFLKDFPDLFFEECGILL